VYNCAPSVSFVPDMNTSVPVNGGSVREPCVCLGTLIVRLSSGVITLIGGAPCFGVSDGVVAGAGVAGAGAGC
jgi:hypothetical protein